MKWMHYRVTEPANEEAKEVFAGIRKMLKADKEMQADVNKLAKICCSPQQFLGIQSLPKSAKVGSTV
jgi:hypothetical protein